MYLQLNENVKSDFFFFRKKGWKIFTMTSVTLPPNPLHPRLPLSLLLAASAPLILNNLTRGEKHQSKLCPINTVVLRPHLFQTLL